MKKILRVTKLILILSQLTIRTSSTMPHGQGQTIARLKEVFQPTKSLVLQRTASNKSSISSEDEWEPHAVITKKRKGEMSSPFPKQEFNLTIDQPEKPAEKIVKTKADKKVKNSMSTNLEAPMLIPNKENEFSLINTTKEIKKHERYIRDFLTRYSHTIDLPDNKLDVIYLQANLNKAIIHKVKNAMLRYPELQRAIIDYCSIEGFCVGDLEIDMLMITETEQNIEKLLFTFIYIINNDETLLPKLIKAKTLSYDSKEDKKMKELYQARTLFKNSFDEIYKQYINDFNTTLDVKLFGTNVNYEFLTPSSLKSIKLKKPVQSFHHMVVEEVFSKKFMEDLAKRIIKERKVTLKPDAVIQAIMTVSKMILKIPLLG